jgi:penicillin-binding protein 1A
MNGPRSGQQPTQERAQYRGAGARTPRRPRFRFVRRLAGGGLAVALLTVATGGFLVWRKYEVLSADMPTVGGLRNYQPPVMSRIYAGNGSVIAELAAERRIFAPYAAIPDRVKAAFVSAEDQNFWTHGGVDPLAMLRAGVTDLETMHSGRRPIGASTITQQVARIMLLGSNTVSFQRKAKEALLAMRIEQTLPKERILEIYLNEIYLGAGAYGIAAASQTYFNKPLDQLDDAEAAFLGALPKSPTNYNPYRFPAAARARRDWVLSRMADTGAITGQAAKAAMGEPLIPKSFRRPGPVPGSEWFSEEVRRELVDRYGLDQTTQGGLVVQTSLDPRLQQEATRDMREGLMRYDRQHGGWRGPVAHIEGVTEHPRRTRRGVPAQPVVDWSAALATIARPAGMLPGWQLGVILSTATASVGWLDRAGDDPTSLGIPRTGTLSWADLAWIRQKRAPRVGDVVMVEPGDGGKLQLRQIPEVEGAMVSMDPQTGRVLAMVGGWSFEASQFNRATQALRQPGSSFKPLVYLAAMEQGISPADKFLDAPYVNGNWRPNNYELTFNGPTALHDALRNSLNLVTIRLAAHIGMSAVAKVAIDTHEVDAMPKVLPAALGAVETTVLREAGAYACMAAGGHEVLPSLIDTVQDRDGHVIWRPEGLNAQGVAEKVGGDKAGGEKAGGDPGLPPAIVDARKQVTDPDSTYQVVQMMQDVVKRGTGTEAGAGIDRPLAGKTGTSQDFNDAWFAGFAPNLLTVVWIGFDNPQSLGDKETGGTVAGPIWNRFMKAALADTPKLDFRVPDGLSLVRYNTGQGTTVDAFKPGQEPGLTSMIAADNGSEQLGPQDTGAENVADSESEMASVPGPGVPGSTTSVDPSNPGLASPASAAQPGASPAGTPAVLAGASGRSPQPAPASPAHGAGGDIGMGGLY